MFRLNIWSALIIHLDLLECKVAISISTTIYSLGSSQQEYGLGSSHVAYNYDVDTYLYASKTMQHVLSNVSLVRISRKKS